jgi:predicted nuclease of predicted toxin-antitoxin system
VAADFIRPAKHKQRMAWRMQSAATNRILYPPPHPVSRTSDIGLRDADDSPIWDYALKREAVIVTKDEDFPHRLSQSRETPVIVWLRIGNTSRRALLQWFEPVIPQVVELIERGDKLIEVR